MAARIVGPTANVETGTLRIYGGVLLSSFLVSFGVGVIVPLLPTYAEHFGLTAFEVGVVVAAFTIVRFVITPVAHTLLVRLPLRTVGVAGASVVVFGAGFTAVATNYPMLVAGRALHGAGVAMFLFTGLVVAERFMPSGARARTISAHHAAMVLAVSAGPLIGAALYTVGGLVTPNLAAAAVAVVAIVHARALPAEPVPRSRSGADMAPARVPPAWRTTIAVTLLGGAVAWGLRAGVRYTLTPLALDRAGFSGVGLGMTLSLMMVGDLGGLVAGARLMDRFGRRMVLIVAPLALALPTVMLGVANGAALVVAVLAYGALNGAMSSPSAVMAADLQSSWRMALTASRLMGDVGLVIGPLLLGRVTDVAGLDEAFWWAAIAGMCIGIAAIAVRETRP